MTSWNVDSFVHVFHNSKYIRNDLEEAPASVAPSHGGGTIGTDVSQVLGFALGPVSWWLPGLCR